MAIITTRNKTNGNPSFTAQVRIKKSGKVIFSKSETFSQRKLAEKWATGTEKAWHEGTFSLVAPAGTFAELIKRYRLDVEKEVGKTMIQCLRTLESMHETDVGCHEVNPTFLNLSRRQHARRGRGFGLKVKTQGHPHMSVHVCPCVHASIKAQKDDARAGIWRVP